MSALIARKINASKKEATKTAATCCPPPQKGAYHSAVALEAQFMVTPNLPLRPSRVRPTLECRPTPPNGRPRMRVLSPK